MKEDISNRPNAEAALEAEFAEKNTAAPEADASTADGKIDASSLPKGMRERVETVEISTLKPKG